MAKTTGKRSVLWTVISVIVVLLVVVAVIGLIVHFTSDDKPPGGETFAVKYNGQTLGGGSSIGLMDSGVDFTGDYARAFTAVFVIADALDRAGSVEPEAIRQALRETDIVNDEDFQLILPWEGVKFDEKGQNIYATGIVTQFIDGQYQTVWPEANKAIDPVVPLTGWN